MNYINVSNYRSERLTTLAKGLSPSILRLGGQSANFMTYVPKTSDKDGYRSTAVLNRDHSNIIYDTNLPKFRRHINLNGDILQNSKPIPPNHPKYKYHEIPRESFNNANDKSRYSDEKKFRIPRSAYNYDETLSHNDINKISSLKKGLVNFTMTGKNYIVSNLFISLYTCFV